MASPCRSLLLALALGLAAAVGPGVAGAAAPAQDPGATFGTGDATTVVSTTAAPAATTTTSANNQTLVESEDQPETAIFTESRKVAAVIGGLVFVALAILLLTVRYIRVTKPVARTEAAEPVAPAGGVELDDDEVFVGVALNSAAPGADHAGADADWEPRTDEHQRVEIPSASAPVRPSAAARRKTLGVPGD